MSRREKSGRCSGLCIILFLGTILDISVPVRMASAEKPGYPILQATQIQQLSECSPEAGWSQLAGPATVRLSSEPGDIVYDPCLTKPYLSNKSLNRLDVPGLTTRTVSTFRSIDSQPSSAGPSVVFCNSPYAQESQMIP